MEERDETKQVRKDGIAVPNLQLDLNFAELFENTGQQAEVLESKGTCGL